MLDYSKDYRGDKQTTKVGGLKAIASGEYTTSGGNVEEVASITDKYIESGDMVIASIKDDGTNNVTLLMAEVTADDQITFTFSGNPVADTVVTYLILKA